MKLIRNRIHPMKCGLAVDGDSSPKILEEIALKGEELGFDCFLVTDHFTKGSVDAWTFLPYLAGRTHTIRLGTCVTPIPFRSPAILAKMIATFDNLSNGRTILGAGIGWNKPEFEGFSKWLETSDRVKATQEGLDLIVRLWTEDEPVNFEGKFTHAAGAIVDPKPIQKPHPDIWFGAHGQRTLRLTGKIGSGWIPVGPRWAGEFFPPPEAYSEMKKTIGESMRKNGRDQSHFVYSMLINYADDILKLKKEVEDYVDAGMNYFILGMSGQNENCSEKIAKVSNEIIRSL